MFHHLFRQSPHPSPAQQRWRHLILALLLLFFGLSLIICSWLLWVASQPPALAIHSVTSRWTPIHGAQTAVWKGQGV